MAIDLTNRKFIQTYVQTALYDAGNYLEAKPAEEVLKTARQNEWIREDVRPIVLNYTDNSWNWGNTSFAGELIKGIFSLFSKSSPPPERLTKEEAERANKEEEEKKKESSATQATIIGTGLVLIGGFFSGKLYGRVQHYYQTVRYAEQFYEATQKMEKSDLKEALQNLVKCQLNIDRLRANKITNYLCAAGGVTLGGAALVVGGILRVHPLIPCGYLTVIFSVAAAIINAGYHSNDAKEIRKNYELIAGDKKTHNGWAQHILTHLLPYWKTTEDQNYLPPVYNPLYPDLYQSQFVNVVPSAPAWDA